MKVDLTTEQARELLEIYWDHVECLASGPLTVDMEDPEFALEIIRKLQVCCQISEALRDQRERMKNLKELLDGTLTAHSGSEPATSSECGEGDNTELQSGTDSDSCSGDCIRPRELCACKSGAEDKRELDDDTFNYSW